MRFGELRVVTQPLLKTGFRLLQSPQFYQKCAKVQRRPRRTVFLLAVQIDSLLIDVDGVVILAQTLISETKIVGCLHEGWV